jgi:Ca-activated chloride channel family protein
MLRIRKFHEGKTNIAKRTILRMILLLGFGAMPCYGAGLLIAEGGFGGVLEIEEHSVNVTINNGIAVTEVTQVFRNTERRQVEALYTFPVPKDASVANFSMWINGKEMIGEVVEKQRARQIYDSYKQRKRDPGLLEQNDYRTFEMRIFPIAAGAQQKVQVAYYQELPYDHDWATYVYPLATSTRPAMDTRVKNKFSLTIHVRSEVPIAAMESPSHNAEFVMTQHADTYWMGSLETSGGSLARDVVLAYQTKRASTGIDLICSKPQDEDGFFYLTLTAGEELAQSNDAMDYLFILDISGSMAHDGKLSLSRKTISAFVDSLDDTDRLDVITFNVQANTLFNQLRRADVTAQEEARMFLASQAARGGTELRPALTTAFKYADPDRVLNIVIFSDGMTQQQEREILVELIKQRPANVRVFCVGVGNDVNRPLLQQIAEDAGGLASFLSQGDDFERQAQAFRRKLTHPAATYVQIQIEGLDVYDIEPKTLPNLFHGAPIRMFGRYRGGGDAKVQFLAEINGREFHTEGKLTFDTMNLQNPQIERMWAWHRIQNLLRRTNHSPDAVNEVIRLGEKFSIVTEYTSFLVLENDGEYQRWKIDRRNALRMKRDRSSQQNLAKKLESLRQDTANRLGPQMADPVKADPIVIAKRSDPKPPTFGNVPDSPESKPDPRKFDIPLTKPRGGGPVGPILIAIAAYLGFSQRKSRRKDRS